MSREKQIEEMAEAIFQHCQCGLFFSEAERIADFVINQQGYHKIVQCKNCTHYTPYEKPIEDFDGKCIVRECETDEMEFCSYGEPKMKGGAE